MQTTNSESAPPLSAEEIISSSNLGPVIERRIISLGQSSLAVYVAVQNTTNNVKLPFHFICRTDIVKFLKCGPHLETSSAFEDTERFNLRKEVILLHNKVFPSAVTHNNVFFSLFGAKKFMASVLSSGKEKMSSSVIEAIQKLGKALDKEFPSETRGKLTPELNLVPSHIFQVPLKSTLPVMNHGSVAPTPLVVPNSGKRPRQEESAPRQEETTPSKKTAIQAQVATSTPFGVAVPSAFCFPSAPRTSQIGSLLTRINEVTNKAILAAWNDFMQKNPKHFELMTKVFGPFRLPQPTVCIENAGMESCYMWNDNSLGLVKYLNPDVSRFEGPICSDMDQAELAAFAAQILAFYKNKDLDPRLRERYSLIATSQLEKLHSTDTPSIPLPDQ